MANTSTDLTEEDAADLQFPKAHSSGMVLTPNLSKAPTIQLNEIISYCANCQEELCAPFILCAKCNIPLCSRCFANGVEFLGHESNHDYLVINDNSTLFDNSSWTAKEELVLLDTLTEFGNFDLVTKQLPHLTANEVQDHYEHFYLNKYGSKLLPSFTVTETSMFPQPTIPYRFKLTGVDEPPRYAPNSTSFNLVAGYNAARSDFELEYDSNAEDLISNLEYIDYDDPNYELITNLQCAIIRSYNRRLLERLRRKNIIRNHGLILTRKVLSSLHNYDVTITRVVYERMCRFMQFFSGIQFDYIMEGLHLAGEFKVRISRLCDCRKKGIKTLAGAQLYHTLKEQREELMRNVRAFEMNPELIVKLKNITTDLPVPSVIFGKKRGTFTPLEILGLPGYEKLSLKEQDLCRSIRLVPLSYLEFKQILISEWNKMRYLKLQTARRLLKIDVNKTRRLFDFLVTEGYITTPKD